MDIKSLDELRQVDQRTLHFTPMGLGVGVQMRPDDAAQFQQQVVAQFELAPAVAEGTRKSFQDLRTVFAYGVLCYEIFTLVGDHALLVIEQALRDRFIDYHDGTVTFVDPDGVDHRVTAQRYEQVSEFSSRHRNWQLRVTDGLMMRFNGTLAGLREWARHVGLLRGQRNRGIEQALSNLRNFVAHPNGYHLGGPVEAAGTLSDLAEIINHLWGMPTPGGRLYPAPIRREVIVMAWNDAGTDMNTALAKDLPHAVDPDDQTWRCVILRAVFRPDHRVADPGLHEYDARFEVAHFPTDLLWGPGSITEAAAWFAEHHPDPDDCDYLDRTFVVRHTGSDLYLPMRPSVAANVPDADRSGQWYAVKADHPNDAYHHVRNLVTSAGCDRRGPCRGCHAETLHVGTHQQVFAHIINDGTAPPPPPDVTTPWAHPRFRRVDPVEV
ncbi:hypothetical protein ACTMTJ_34425 [Phytohabitans sp. LJ34]|uniref:hypothetical protein n=1 Tax=Phytohabitans sp. LJ34 TaxID=3452217 RepID=UPI003F8C2BAE